MQVPKERGNILSLRILVLLFIATLMAAFLRLHKLDQLPPGFTFDEAAHALDALDILNGSPMLVSSRLKEAPAVYSYLLAGAFYLFGASPLVQRTTIALCGVLLIPVNFVAVLQMFRQESGRKAWFLAAFSSLLLSTSLWAVLASRIGYEYILPPILALAAVAFFWRGYREPRWGLLSIAAVFASGTYYLYNGALLSLLVIPAAVLLHKLVILLHRRTVPPESRPQTIPGTESQNIWPQVEVSWKVLIFFTGVVVLLASPLLSVLYDWSNIQDQRTVNSLIFAGSDSPVERLVESLSAHAQTFLGIHGDEYWWRGLPVLNPVLGICLVVGLLVSLKRLRQLPYLFVLVYWVGMLSGTVLTFGGSVRHFRMAGALPPTYLLISIAWLELYNRLKRSLTGVPWFSLRVYAPVIALSPFLFAALIWLPAQTYYDYFIRWGDDPGLAYVHDVSSVKLVERMERETNPGAIFVLPRSAAVPRPNYILDFLYSGRTPLRYVTVDESSLPQVLTRELAGYRTVHLITSLRGAREGVQYEATSDGLLPLLLTQHGKLSSVEDTEDYILLTYALESDQEVFRNTHSRWQVPADFKRLSIAAAGLELAGVRQQVQDDILLVDLAWKRQSEVASNYTVFLHLLDDRGQRVVGVDAAPERGFRTLGLNEVMVINYAIPFSANVGPGRYTLLVGLYYLSGDQSVYIGAAPLPDPIIIE